MRSRTFLNVSLGILALALAYHFGAQTAQGQGGAPVTGFSVFGQYGGGSGPGLYVLTPNGDLYFNALNQSGFFTQTSLVGNFWGGATPVEATTFGSLKARYRGERRPQGVKPSTNR